MFATLSILKAHNQKPDTLNTFNNNHRSAEMTHIYVINLNNRGDEIDKDSILASVPVFTHYS